MTGWLIWGGFAVSVAAAVVYHGWHYVQWSRTNTSYEPSWFEFAVYWVALVGLASFATGIVIHQNQKRHDFSNACHVHGGEVHADMCLAPGSIIKIVR